MMDNRQLAGRTRQDILKAALSVGKIGAHIAPSLSIVEITLAILMECSKEDVFVLSKGHGGLGYYAAMHQLGMLTDEQFESFETDGGEFPGQPSRSIINKIIYSSGSLGMGLSYGAGRAYANQNSKIYVLLGDGECNEGSVWEGAALAAKLRLSNLIVVVDQNSFQSDGRCEDILGLDYEKIWSAYGWKVKKCDGHDIDALKQTLKDISIDQPTVILASTIKGKGISFMENDNTWHHNVLREDLYSLALGEIGDTYGL